MSGSLLGAVDRLEQGLGELQAEHLGRKGLADFARYANDPVGFFREVLKVQRLWDKQVEMAELVRDHEQVAVAGANGTGKDWTAARLALWWVYARRGLVLLTGPTERQVKVVCMSEVARAFAGSPDLPGKLFEGALKLDSTEAAGIVAFVTRDVSSLTGYHAPSLLAIITEAQGIEPWGWEGILSNAIGEDSRILAVGNPLVASGPYFDCFRSKGWQTLKLSALDHPNVVEGRNVIPGAVTRQGVQRIVDQYGRQSSIYQARVLAEFPENIEEALIQRAWCHAAADRFESGEFEVQGTRDRLGIVREPSHVKTWAYVAGLDPARFGADTTALCLRQGPIVREFVTWAKRDTMETVGRLLETLRQRGAALIRPNRDHGPHNLVTRRVIVDEIGLGAGVLDRLREQGYAVDGFNGGKAPSSRFQPDRFHNLRAQGFWKLRDNLERGKIALPRNEQLFDELCAMQWRPNSTGKIQIESKDDLKARIGRSPDLADSLCLAFADDLMPQGWRVAEVIYAT